jgi:hypothetical protein
MWMLFGLYGNQQLEMGMFYSRVIKANSLFVKEIKVRFFVCICINFSGNRMHYLETGGSISTGHYHIAGPI